MRKNIDFIELCVITGRLRAVRDQSLARAGWVAPRPAKRLGALDFHPLKVA